MRKIILTAALLGATTHVNATDTMPWFTDNASPICAAVYKKANEVYGSVIKQEQQTYPPSLPDFDQMDLLTKQKALQSAETLQNSLHGLVTTVHWLVDNHCFPPDKEPNWRTVLDTHDKELQHLDAYVWGLRTLIEREQEAE